MKKPLLAALLSLLLIPAIVRSQSPISISIITPTTGRSSDGLSIIVNITSTYSMDTVKATVSGRSTVLTRQASDGTFRGVLILTGLPQGLQQLTIYARDVMGNTQTAIQNFTFDSYPSVNVISPVENATYQTKLHIKATVSDPGHANCTGKVSTVSGTSLSYVNFSFRNSIDTLVDFFPPQTTSGSIQVTISAIDSVGQQTTKIIDVNCDKSPFLISIYADTSGYQIADFKDHRVVLYTQVNNASIVKIHNLTDNTNQSVPIGNRILTSAKLSTSGLVLSLATGESDSLFVWSNNTLTNINQITNVPLSSGDFSIGGDNFIWHSQPAGIRVTNVVTLNTTLVDNNDVLNVFDDIDSLGNIAYSATQNIYKYNIGTQAKTQITNDASTSFNFYAAVESNNVLYIKRPNPSGYTRLHLFDGVIDHNLGITPNPGDKRYFSFKNGYSTFSLYDQNSISQVWVRRPDTSMKQLSFFSTVSLPDIIGNKGQVLFINNFNRYYADSLTSARLVSGSGGSTYSTNGAFYLGLGNTLFIYKNLTTSNIAAVVTSFTPVIAGKGATVKIKGTNFTGASNVTFGGVKATSFNIIGDTTIMAVVGTGATGNVSVTGYSGAGTLAGFTFIATPTITSFTTAAGTGSTVTITGTGFTNASAVSFGGTAAASFTVASDTQIQAVVAAGTTGNISVTTPGGTVTKTGFTFEPVPTITYTAATPSFLTGGSILLTASTGAGFVYQWTVDGRILTGVTSSTFTATVGGAYTVKIVSGSGSAASAPLQVTVVFDLPANSFTVETIDASCKGSKNGQILFGTTTLPALSFTAEVTGNGIDSVYHFTGSAKANNLGAGTYNLCITVDGQSDFKQCYTAVIGEPKDLSLFTSVDQPNRTVTLTLDGGNVYTIKLNNALYTTANGSITLNLMKGDNVMTVSTDRECQGIIVKHISVGNDITIFPNPVDNVLNITLGQDQSKVAKVEVRDLNGIVVYSGSYANQYGSIQVDVSKLISGTHVVKLQLDNSVTVFKIVKK